MPAEYVARWQGARIGSGATVLHFTSTASAPVAQAMADQTRTFFDAIRTVLPSSVTITFDPEVRILSPQGDLEAVIPVGRPNAVVGTGSSTAFTNGIGACLRWNTGVVSGGRRLNGRTFLVPLASAAFTGGNVSQPTVTLVSGAGNALIAAGTTSGATLVVWSRTNAVFSQALSATCLERPSPLRTRNDR